jgi:hypothetical protein
MDDLYYVTLAQIKVISGMIHWGAFFEQIGENVVVHGYFYE